MFEALVRLVDDLLVKVTAPTGLFVPGHDSNDYVQWISAQTEGLVIPLINGRSSGGTGPDQDLTEPLDQMQTVVQDLHAGDRVCLAAWLFDPGTLLTDGSGSWGDLFAAKANEDVLVRILISDFNPILGRTYTWAHGWCDDLDAIIDTLPDSKRDNLKYLLTLHPASLTSRFVQALIQKSIPLADACFSLGSYHEKILVAKASNRTIAFCGGLDIEYRKTPTYWSYDGLIGWHDLACRLEGPIARDLEKEFVLRWNREQDNPHPPLHAGWQPYERLPIPSPPGPGDADADPGKRIHRVQAARTVSSARFWGPFTSDRTEIASCYDNLVRLSTSFLYLENQYFRSPALADRLASQASARPGLIAIFVVIQAVEEGSDPITLHGQYLQHEFFNRVLQAFGDRASVFTMFGRSVHSKFALADDRYLTIGSANANPRSLMLDTELNVFVDDATLAADFRIRLWAHNLGLQPADVAGWDVGQFQQQWKAVADANQALAIPDDPSGWSDMSGEGIIPFDPLAVQGARSTLLPDALAEVDFDDQDAVAPS